MPTMITPIQMSSHCEVIVRALCNMSICGTKGGTDDKEYAYCRGRRID